MIANGHSLDTETQQELRGLVNRVCDDYPDTYWLDVDEQARYPEEFVNAMTKTGLLGALIPEEYGGLGLGITDACVIVEQVHRRGGNASALHAQLYTMGAVLRHGSDKQKQQYLPDIASGKLRLQAFGVTEPTAGTDTSAITTRAVRDGDNYIVNGQKVWTSRYQHSDLMLLLARTSPIDDTTKRTKGLSMFLVDLRQAQGITVKPIKTMVNHETNEVFFDDVAIPASSLVGEEGEGFRYILTGMNDERILIASECVGDGRWFVERASQYANDRVVFGRPIGQNQGIQFPIATAYAHVEAADLMRRQAASLSEAKKDCGAEANMAKMLAADASWEAANACLQTYGGFGFASEYHVERKFRETRLYQVAPISTNLILSYLAQHVLGMPRSF